MSKSKIVRDTQETGIVSEDSNSGLSETTITTTMGNGEASPQKSRIRNTTPLPVRFCVGDFIEGTKLVSIFNGVKVERALIVNPTNGKVTNYTDTPAVKGMARAMLKNTEDNCQIVLAMPLDWFLTASEEILNTLAFTASRMVSSVSVTVVEPKSTSDISETAIETAIETVAE